MKKLFLGLICFICVIALFACDASHSVSDSTPPEKLPNTDYLSAFVKGFTVDNQKLLSEIVKTSYSLQDLQEYFGRIPYNELAMYGEEGQEKYIQEVNERFPIECVRKTSFVACYSVYKVTEGGWFYVFWTLSVEDTIAITNGGEASTAKVYFTTYIQNLKNVEDFGEIKSGISTAEDVARVDPAMELNLAMSSSPYSFHVLSNGMFLNVKYQESESITARSGLIVEKVEVISKETAQACSHMDCVLPQDLPD